MNVDLLIKENKELSEEAQRYKNMWFITNNALAGYRKLEEELGCPLEVLGKAIIQNCFYDGSDYKETNIGFINQEGGLGIVISVEEWEYGNTMYLKDYNKTWWLRKDKSE